MPVAANKKTHKQTTSSANKTNPQQRNGGKKTNVGKSTKNQPAPAKVAPPKPKKVVEPVPVAEDSADDQVRLAPRAKATFVQHLNGKTEIARKYFTEVAKAARLIDKGQASDEALAEAKQVLADYKKGKGAKDKGNLEAISKDIAATHASIRVAAGTSAYLASILESIIMELLNFAYENAKKSEDSMLHTSHIFPSSVSDNDESASVTSLNTYPLLALSYTFQNAMRHYSNVNRSEDLKKHDKLVIKRTAERTKTALRANFILKKRENGKGIKKSPDAEEGDEEEEVQSEQQTRATKGKKGKKGKKGPVFRFKYYVRRFWNQYLDDRKDSFDDDTKKPRVSDSLKDFISDVADNFLLVLSRIIRNRLAFSRVKTVSYELLNSIIFEALITQVSTDTTKASYQVIKASTDKDGTKSKCHHRLSVVDNLPEALEAICNEAITKGQAQRDERKKKLASGDAVTDGDASDVEEDDLDAE